MPTKTTKVTTDHDKIKAWAQKRDAHPATVKSTKTSRDVGVIRLDFPGFTGEGTLEPITWKEFFQKFDEQGLAFVYQEKTAAGRTSSFNRFVKRENASMSKRGSSKRTATKRPVKRAATKRSGTKKTSRRRSTTASRSR